MTSETADAGNGGLALKHQVVLNASGQEIERRQPAAPGTSAAGSSDVPTTTVTIYYSPGSGNSDSDCNDRPEWSGLPCKIGPPANTPTSAKLTTKWVAEIRPLSQAAAYMRIVWCEHDHAGRG